MARGVSSVRANRRGANALRKAAPSSYAASYPAGAYTWTCPERGQYRFVMWGGGSRARSADGHGGASGAFIWVERPLHKGEAVSLVVGSENIGVTSRGDTVVTLPRGLTLTAGGGKCDSGTNTGGHASLSGGQQLAADILIDGSPGQTGSGVIPGADAPGSLPYRGGKGGYVDIPGGAITVNASAPGGGGILDNSSGIGGGGSGLVLIERVL